MSTKWIFSCTLLLAVLVACPTWAEDFPSSPEILDASRTPAPADHEAVPSVAAPPAGLAKWLTYSQPGCCGPVGGDGPIKTELYLRTGPTLPVEGTIFGHVLETGWIVEGGGRSLFFDPGMDRAWAIDLSLRNIRNQGQRNDFDLVLGVPRPARATVRNLNRTVVDVGLGREWYCWAPSSNKTTLRYGIDVSGGLGTERLELHEFPHRTDFMADLRLALHADFEVPRGCCTFFAGFRTEWVYNWMMDLIQDNDSELEDVNFLFTFGVRF